MVVLSAALRATPGDLGGAARWMTRGPEVACGLLRVWAASRRGADWSRGVYVVSLILRSADSHFWNTHDSTTAAAKRSAVHRRRAASSAPRPVLRRSSCRLSARAHYPDGRRVHELGGRDRHLDRAPRTRAGMSRVETGRGSGAAAKRTLLRLVASPADHLAGDRLGPSPRTCRPACHFGGGIQGRGNADPSPRSSGIDRLPS